MVRKAQELAKAHGWFETKQFENEAGPRYHASTTGPEILSAFASKQLHYWVSGYGTGGTFQGVGKVLRQASPETKIVLAEPEVAPLLTSGVQQERNADGTPSGSHPAFKPHMIQGWTPDFIPQVAETGRSLGLYDEVELINNAEAISTALLLARKEGIFTGISGGASFAVALRVAERAPKGANIVAMLADTAERYL
ncbi:chloroplast O-acetyl-serine lyase, partial [Ochromonadaceae sp. CCMP2298]